MLEASIHELSVPQFDQDKSYSKEMDNDRIPHNDHNLHLLKLKADVAMTLRLLCSFGLSADISTISTAPVSTIELNNLDDLSLACTKDRSLGTLCLTL